MPGVAPQDRRPAPDRGPRSWTARLSLLAASVVVGLLLCELILRVAGVEYHTFPTVQFGWPEPEVIAKQFEPERDLFWVPRTYPAMLEDARKFQPVVTFLGDSCTQFGTYPRLTLERMEELGHRDLARGVKLAVAGWSTVQGLTQIRRDIVPLSPRIVTIYYGWNDHWVALGPPDDEARPGGFTFWLSQHLRLYQMLVKAKLGHAARQLESRPNRVSLARYHTNLTSMARAITDIGGRPIFITAPSGHVAGHEPEYLAKRHVRSLAELVPLHQSYVRETRAAAAESGALLCDAAYTFEHLPPPVGSYFMRDGIHLSDEGNRHMTQVVSDCILRAAGRN
jgi:lysophospholipase L1-like esterase